MIFLEPRSFLEFTGAPPQEPDLPCFFPLGQGCLFLGHQEFWCCSILIQNVFLQFWFPEPFFLGFSFPLLGLFRRVGHSRVWIVTHRRAVQSFFFILVTFELVSLLTVSTFAFVTSRLSFMSLRPADGRCSMIEFNLVSIVASPVDPPVPVPLSDSLSKIESNFDSISESLFIFLSIADIRASTALSWLFFGECYEMTVCLSPPDNPYKHKTHCCALTVPDHSPWTWCTHHTARLHKNCIQSFLFCPTSKMPCRFVAESSLALSAVGLCTVRWRLTISHHCPIPLFERGILLVGQGFLLSRFDHVDNLNIGAAILGFKAPAACGLDNRLVVTAGCLHSGFNAVNDCIHRSESCWRTAMWLINI